MILICFYDLVSSFVSLFLISSGCAFEFQLSIGISFLWLSCCTLKITHLYFLFRFKLLILNTYICFILNCQVFQKTYIQLCVIKKQHKSYISGLYAFGRVLGAALEKTVGSKHFQQPLKEQEIMWGLDFNSKYSTSPPSRHRTFQGLKHKLLCLGYR